MKRIVVLVCLAVVVAAGRSSIAQVCPNGSCESGETVAGCSADCGILNDFESGTDGWDVGSSGVSPSTQANGGPLGAGDAYLEVVSDGSAANGRLVVLNESEWTGDFTARGQTMVYVHAANFGASALSLRIWLEDGLGSAANDAVSTDPLILPADGRWYLLAFDVSASALTGSDVANLLTGVARTRIYHSLTATAPGPNVTATLGLDNISNQPLAPICGDNDINGSDLCDGVDLGGADCTDVGYAAAGTLACNATCDGYDDSGCSAECGNGVGEPGEDCDDSGDSGTCDGDCTGVSCGDGYCNPAAGETIAGCAADCVILHDFEDGTNQNWVIGGGGAAPTNQPTGGPLGADDNYLEQSSGGDGEPVRMVVFNGTEWSGDFTARGQTTVTFHAVNLGATDLTLRVWLEDGANTAVTTTGQSLPADGFWRLFTFDISAGSLTGTDVANLLTQVLRTRIYHDTDTTFPPPAITATLGLDNISNQPLAAICGDGAVNDDDTCDGPDLDGLDCTDFGYVEAAGLACAVACDAFDTAGCSAVCPNGTQEPGEVCDESVDTSTCDGDCTAVTCSDGYCNGAVEDAASCAADCADECGDGLITGAEVCDGSDLGGSDCTDVGFDVAAGLACAGDCLSFDSSGCMNMSDAGVADGGMGDAGVMPDAGAMPDAGPMPDGGATPGPDAGDPPAPDYPGACDCGSGGTAGGGAALILFAVVGAFARRRRRPARG